jgi:hypothetical protein
MHDVQSALYIPTLQSTKTKQKLQSKPQPKEPRYAKRGIERDLLYRTPFIVTSETHGNVDGGATSLARIKGNASVEKDQAIHEIISEPDHVFAEFMKYRQRNNKTPEGERDGKESLGGAGDAHFGVTG